MVFSHPCPLLVIFNLVQQIMWENLKYIIDSIWMVGTYVVDFKSNQGVRVHFFGNGMPSHVLHYFCTIRSLTTFENSKSKHVYKTYYYDKCCHLYIIHIDDMLMWCCHWTTNTNEEHELYCNNSYFIVCVLCWVVGQVGKNGLPSRTTMVVAIIESLRPTFLIICGHVIVRMCMSHVTTIPHVVLFGIFKSLHLYTKLPWSFMAMVATSYSQGTSLRVCEYWRSVHSCIRI